MSELTARHQSVIECGRSLATLTILCLGGLSPNASAIPLTACIDDRPWIPYTHPQSAGSMQILVEMAAQKVGVELRIQALPWKRCQEEVRWGRIDSMVGAAFVPFNEDIAVFPKRRNKVDPKQSLGTAKILLARRRGSSSGWDGAAFSNLEMPVGVAKGTQVMIEAVERSGARVDDGGKTDWQNLIKLKLKRIDLMAAYEADLALSMFPGHHHEVEILPDPLIVADYYLAFSKDFRATHPHLSERLWKEIGALKGSKAYQSRIGRLPWSQANVKSSGEPQAKGPNRL